jgi:hypothetical protein
MNIGDFVRLLHQYDVVLECNEHSMRVIIHSHVGDKEFNLKPSQFGDAYTIIHNKIHEERLRKRREDFIDPRQMEMF